LRLSILAGSVLCSPATWLLADAQAQTLQSDGATVTLEEITVTATKRTESLQDVPIAISVLSQQLVEDGNLDELSDFVDLIPNATFAQDSNTSSEISIRGSGRNISEEDPSVGLYRDGVYVGGLLFSTANFYDMAQVEILRGPQGGLYGRNAVGGALNVVSQRPEHDFGGYVEAQFGRKERQEYRAAVNLPIVQDKWAVRVAGLRIEQDKGFDYIVNQRKYSDAVENSSLRIRSLYTPVENWEFLTTIEGLDVEGGAPLGVLAPDAEYGYLDANATIPAPGTRPRDTAHQYRNTPEERRLKQIQAIQEINWTVAHGKATAIFSYRDATFDSSRDEDLTEHDISEIMYDASQKSLFTEIRFASNAFNGFKFVTGVSYLDEDVTLNFDNRIGSNFAGELGGASIAELYAAGVVTEAWAPIFGVPVGAPISLLGLTPGATGWGGYLGDTFPTQFINEQSLQSLALFLEADYALTDRVTAWANVRYTRDDKSIDFAQTFGMPSRCPVACPEIFALIFNGLDPVIQDATSKTFTNVSPGGGLNFAVSADVLLYAKAVTGFKAGGFNSVAGRLQEMPFDEEETTGYELGAKTQWFDQRLVLNAAAFLQTRKNALVTVADPVMPINSLGVNAGKIENRGVEVDMSVRPIAPLRLQVALGYLNAEFKEFVVGDVDFAGNRVPRTFKYTLSSVVSYTQPITDLWDVFAYASYRNAWDGYTDNDNIEKMSQPEITDLRIGLKGPTWKIVGYIDNVFDNRYTAWEARSLYDTSRHWGAFSPGRTYGVQAGFKF
jgi:iron complex outermembrane receptor protein